MVILSVLAHLPTIIRFDTIGYGPCVHGSNGSFCAGKGSLGDLRKKPRLGWGLQRDTTWGHHTPRTVDEPCTARYPEASTTPAQTPSLHYRSGYTSVPLVLVC